MIFQNTEPYLDPTSLPESNRGQSTVMELVNHCWFQTWKAYIPCQLYIICDYITNAILLITYLQILYYILDTLNNLK